MDGAGVPVVIENILEHTASNPLERMFSEIDEAFIFDSNEQIPSNSYWDVHDETVLNEMNKMNRHLVIKHGQFRTPTCGGLYPQIPFHFCIPRSGKVWHTRDLTSAGGYLRGHYKQGMKSVGICLIGNYEVEKPSEGQIEALRAIIDKLVTVGVKIKEVHGFNPETYPLPPAPGGKDGSFVRKDGTRSNYEGGRKWQFSCGKELREIVPRLTEEPVSAKLEE